MSRHRSLVAPARARAFCTLAMALPALAILTFPSATHAANPLLGTWRVGSIRGADKDAAQACRAFAELEFRDRSVWIKLGQPDAALLFGGSLAAQIGQQVLSGGQGPVTALVTYTDDGKAWFVNDQASGQAALVLEPRGPDLFELINPKHCVVVRSSALTPDAMHFEVFGVDLGRERGDALRSRLVSKGAKIVQEVTPTSRILVASGSDVLGVPGPATARYILDEDGRVVIVNLNRDLGDTASAKAHFDQRARELSRRFVVSMRRDGWLKLQGPTVVVELMLNADSVVREGYEQLMPRAPPAGAATKP